MSDQNKNGFSSMVQALNGVLLSVNPDKQELEAEIQRLCKVMLPYFTDDCSVPFETPYGPDMVMEVVVPRYKETMNRKKVLTRQLIKQGYISSKPWMGGGGGAMHPMAMMQMRMVRIDEETGLPEDVDPTLWRYLAYTAIYHRLTNAGKIAPLADAKKALDRIMRAPKEGPILNKTQNLAKNWANPVFSWDQAVETISRLPKPGDSVIDSSSRFSTVWREEQKARNEVRRKRNVHPWVKMPIMTFAGDIMTFDSVLDAKVHLGLFLADWSLVDAKVSVPNSGTTTDEECLEIAEQVRGKILSHHSSLMHLFSALAMPESITYVRTADNDLLIFTSSANYGEKTKQYLWHRGMLYSRTSDMRTRKIFESKPGMDSSIEEWLSTPTHSTSANHTTWFDPKHRKLVDVLEFSLGAEVFIDRIVASMQVAFSDCFDDFDVRFYCHRPACDDDPLEFAVVLYGPLMEIDGKMTRRYVRYDSTNPNFFFHSYSVAGVSPNLPML